MPLPTEADVVIVGAGPAGAIAAHDLARGGMRAVLVDRAAPPRQKTCGGGILARVVAALPVPIDAVVESVCHTAEIGDAAAGRSFRVSRAAPLVSMTTRSAFDATLVRAAEIAGAGLIAPAEVIGLTRTPDRVRLETTAGPMVARFAIGADGATGIVARSAGWSDHLECAPALEWEIPVTPEVLSRHAGIARFDFGAIPRGYAWVFPKREHLTVGMLASGPGARSVKKALEGYAARLAIRGPGPIERHGAPIPIRPRRGGFGRGRVLLAGDAAGFVDPVLFEGITYAVLSGRAAAAAILEAGLEDAAATRRAYAARIDGPVLGEIRRARLLAPVVYRSEHLRALVFRRFGDALCRAMADVIMGTRSYASLLGDPRSYRRLFSRP